MSAAKRHVVHFVDDDLEVECGDGESLARVIEASGADVTMGCRQGTCGTCRVRVISGADKLNPPKPEECDLLKSIGAQADERLGCQIRVLAPCTITYLGG